MKIGVSSYSYSKYNMDALTIVGKVKEMGFEYMEFSGLPLLPQGEDPLSYAAEIKRACDEAGIKVVSYAVGADFINNGLEVEVERLKDEVKVAAELGASFMRHDATYGFPSGYKGPRGFDDALPILIKGYRAVTEYAEEMGIKTMVENHGFFCQDSDRVEKLINGVNHPNFGLLLDIGNFLCADEDPAKAVGKLLPYVFHVHVKDFHVKSGMLPDPGDGWFKSRGGNYMRGAIIGHGQVPVMQCLKMLKSYGYDGVLSIEFEGMEDPVLGISVGRKNLERYIHMAG